MLTSEKHIFARQQIKRSYRIWISSLPSPLPPALRLLPPHIVQRPLKHLVPPQPIIRQRTRLYERLKRQSHPLDIIKLGSTSSPRATNNIIVQYRDPSYYLPDAVLRNGQFAHDYGC